MPKEIDIMSLMRADMRGEALRIADARRKAMVEFSVFIDEFKTVVNKAVAEAEPEDFIGPHWSELLQLVNQIGNKFGAKLTRLVMDRGAGADAENRCFDLDAVAKFTQLNVNEIREKIEKQNAAIEERRAAIIARDAIAKAGFGK